MPPTFETTGSLRTKALPSWRVDVSKDRGKPAAHCARLDRVSGDRQLRAVTPRILFIAGNRLGDAVLASGVLARLIADYPGARVTIACGAVPAPIFADVPDLERVIVLRRGPLGSHWLDLWRAVSGTRWSAVADLRGSLLAWTLSAQRRLVIHVQRRREHRVLEIAHALGLEPPPAPAVWIAPERAQRIARLLADGPPILAVAPAANWGGKQWPSDRFAAAVARLTGSGGALAGARLAVAAAERERTVAQAVLSSVPEGRRIELVGGGLLDTAAVLARSALFIGNDSGLMHIAAAVGAPTLGLFGPSPEWRYGPWGPRTAVVRTRESHEELTARNAGFDHTSQVSLMGSLTVDMVVEAAEKLLGQPPAGPGAVSP